MPRLKQGILIAVEGIDGSGKTTLARNLATLLQKKEYDLLLTQEPGGTQLGQKIRQLVQNQEIPLCPKTEYLFFAADRAQHFNDVIIPALKENKLVISDRLADSSLAYQGFGRKLDTKIIDIVNTWAMNSIKPDVTVYVSIVVDTALERIQKRRELTAFEKHKDFLQRVAQGFDTLYKNRNDVITLNGTQSEEKITHHAFDKIEQWIQNKNLSH